MTDPFAAPAPVASEHASADSFRGRLVLIEPTGIEYNVPKSGKNPDGPRGNKVTANVTVVDGQGPVQVFAERIPQNKWLDGPTFIGVWFNQDRLALKGGLVDATQNPVQMLKMVLGRLETYKEGRPAGQGNPWGLLPPTEADKQLARDFLANRLVAGASVPAVSNDSDDEPNPFDKGDKAPF